MSIERHPFEPFLPQGAHILFLGSFPPQPHRWCMPFYYPNWINDFWRILGLIHFGDKDYFCIPGQKRFDEHAIRSFCALAGLAFYDTACEVRRLRDNASDAFLKVVTPTDIPALLARIPHCRHIVATGEKAAVTLANTLLLTQPMVEEGLTHLTDSQQITAIDGKGNNMPTELSRCTPPPVGGYIDIVVGESRRPIRFWRMPSSSRAYPLPLEKKAEAYRQLFHIDR